MSIVVTCACGKRLKAADATAGRKVKCPHCGQVLLVPAVLASPSEPASSATGAAKYTSPPTARATDQDPAQNDGRDREPWFTLLAIDFGPARILTVLLILVLAGAAIWYFTRPGRGTMGTQAQKSQPTIPQYFEQIAGAKHKGEHTVVVSNMRQLLIIMQTYVLSHNGQFPETLDALAAFEPSVQPLLVDPHNPGAPVFIYVKPQGPAGSPAAPGNVPILYEARDGKPDPQGAVGLADGQVQLP